MILLDKIRTLNFQSIKIILYIILGYLNKLEYKNFLNDKYIEKNLQNFKKIYKKRPIKNNKGGMMFQHSFFLFLLLKKIKPDLIIESGVYKGHSTYIIEKAAPSSKIFSIDLNLQQRKYISKKTKYFSEDISNLNFEKIPKNTVLFLDDHQNHYERLKLAKFLNIKNIILEDNYRHNDSKFYFYGFDHILKKKKYIHNKRLSAHLKTFFLFSKAIVKKIILNANIDNDIKRIKGRLRDVEKKDSNFFNLKKNINFFYIAPNLYKNKFKNFLTDIDTNNLKSYNFLTYINLK